MIEYRCPGCDSTGQVEEKYAGQVARCRKCGTRFTVPVVNDFSLDDLRSVVQEANISKANAGVDATLPDFWQSIGNLADKVNRRMYWLLMSCLTAMFCCCCGFPMMFLQGSKYTHFEKIASRVDGTRNTMELVSSRREFTRENFRTFCESAKREQRYGDRFYIAVVFDSAENARFPDTKVFTGMYAMTPSDSQAVEHILATYTFNPLNGYSVADFNYRRSPRNGPPQERIQ